MFPIIYSRHFPFRDLAVDLRMKLGDWFRVVQLLKSGGGGGKNSSTCFSSCEWKLPMCFPSRTRYCDTGSKHIVPFGYLKTREIVIDNRTVSDV